MKSWLPNAKQTSDIKRFEIGANNHSPPVILFFLTFNNFNQ